MSVAAVTGMRCSIASRDERLGEHVRSAVVRVAAGPSWRGAVRFPTLDSDGGESTGDDKLDAAICDRAAEELVQLEAATVALVGSVDIL